MLWDLIWILKTYLSLYCATKYPWGHSSTQCHNLSQNISVGKPSLHMPALMVSFVSSTADAQTKFVSLNSCIVTSLSCRGLYSNRLLWNTSGTEAYSIGQFLSTRAFSFPVFSYCAPSLHSHQCSYLRIFPGNIQIYIAWPLTLSLSSCAFPDHETTE